MFKQPLIWIPPGRRIGPSWRSIVDCVWDGPCWLKSKQCLKAEFYLELEHLFKLSLKLTDASQADVLEDLVILKSYSEQLNTSKNRDAPQKTPGIACFTGVKIDQIVVEVRKRYDFLRRNQLPSVESDVEDRQRTLRSTFENSVLVYVPTRSAWFPPSQCVWVDSTAKFPGKASVADAYPSKKAFFTTDLRISEPTVEMYIESLKAGVKEGISPTRIKEIMVSMCSIGLGAIDFSSLANVEFLPIKSATGTPSLASAAIMGDYHDFVIVDNKAHCDAFKDRLPVLDFVIEEIRDTKPLLLAMGLEQQFSSKLVKEVMDVKGGSQDREMSTRLRIKSEAIVRYVASQGSKMN